MGVLSRSDLESVAAHGTNVLPAHPVSPRERWRAAGLGRRRQRSRAGQGLELADPPRVRVGESDLASLDAVLLPALPLRALRRAGLRDDRLERERSGAAAADC